MFTFPNQRQAVTTQLPRPIAPAHARTRAPAGMDYREGGEGGGGGGHAPTTTTGSDEARFPAAAGHYASSRAAAAGQRDRDRFVFSSLALVLWRTGARALG